MTKQKGMIKNIFSFFSYKEKDKKKEFYLPEVNEIGINSNENSQETQTEESKKEQAEQGNGNEKLKNQYSGRVPKNEQKKNQQQLQKDGSKKAEKQQSEQKNESVQKENQQTSIENNIKIKKPIPVSEFNKKKESKRENTESTDDSKNQELKSDIQSNIDLIKKEFNYPTNKDIVIREFLIEEKTRAFLVFIDGMVDRITINNFILAPIFYNADKFKDAKDNCQLDFLMNNILSTHFVAKQNKIDDIAKSILAGDTGIYIDGCDYFIFCETKGYEKRSVSTPQIEAVVRGSQEAFTENLRTNITLLRRIIKNRNLTTEFLTIGKQNSMYVSIVYLDGLINPAIVKEVKRRLNGIKTDFIGSAGMVEQFIEDNPNSLIPTILATERPDRAASHIIEGKLAILVDGSPFSMIVPVTVATLFHSPEDSSLRWQYATMLRFIRIFAVFIAALLPGLYVALTSFHKEMIPTDLLIAIAKAKENVPFPTIIEVVLMEISFELIREAGIRIPGIVGNTIGIIGALILGQAAVQANLVSPVMIIIVAFTGLGNFAVPDFSLAFGLRIIRILFIFAGATLGFYGISLVLVALGFIFVNMKSFGIPFLSTFAPRTRKSHDMLIRWPIWKQEFRPDNVNPLNVRRQPDISREWTTESPDITDSGEGSYD